MQRLSAADEPVFIAKRAVKGVTQFHEIREFEKFILIDSPGLNDINMPTVDWGARFNPSEIITNSMRVDLNLILFKCKIRPDFSDFNILAVLKQTMQNLSPQNTALIFTFADQDEDMNQEYASQFYESLIT